MGKYKELKRVSPEKFRRLTGVKQETFATMVLVLIAAQKSRYRKAGRKGGRLSIEDKLLMAL
jgi:hypothetical protein